MTGRLHPLIVHFPIALLFAAALAHLVGTCRKTDTLLPTVRFCLALGALGALLAVGSGLLFEESIRLTKSKAELLELHELLGFITAATAVGACILLETAVRREKPLLGRLSAWLLYMACILAFVGGHYGGLMVYGKNFFSF